MNIFEKYMEDVMFNYFEEVTSDQLKNILGQTLAGMSKEEKEKFKEQIISNDNLNTFNYIFNELKNEPKNENDKSILMWILNNIVKKNIVLERLSEDKGQIVSALKYYFNNRSVLPANVKKLVNISYNDLKALVNDSSSKKVEDYKFSEAEATKVYENGTHILWKPLTHNASCQLGSGTSWCTAADSEESLIYFNNYTEDSPLYILINKQTKEKYQFHQDSEQYMDKNDIEVNVTKVLTDEDTDKKLVDILSKELKMPVYNLNTITDEKEKTRIILEELLGITEYEITPEGIIVNQDIIL